MSARIIKNIKEYNTELSKKLLEISRPLFINFGITSFGYTRFYKNGNRIILETNSEWFNTYAEAEFTETNFGPNSMIHNINELFCNELTYDTHFHMLSGRPTTKLHEFLVEIDLWNCLSIYVKMNNYVEIFHLASPSDNHKILDLCFNQRDVIQRFIYYFREKIYDLNIDNAPTVYNKAYADVFSQSSSKDKEVALYTNYLTQTPINKFYLKTHDKFISKREVECLHYITLGKSCKEIAKILGISHRTVESYINTLKDKTQLNTKSELIDLGHQNHIGTIDCVI